MITSVAGAAGPRNPSITQPTERTIALHNAKPAIGGAAISAYARYWRRPGATSAPTGNFLYKTSVLTGCSRSLMKSGNQYSSEIIIRGSESGNLLPIGFTCANCSGVTVNPFRSRVSRNSRSETEGVFADLTTIRIGD